MQIQITGRQRSVPQRIKAYIERRVEKLERFFEGITDVHVTVSSEKFRHICELNVHGRGNVYLSATEASEDLKTAVTHALEKVEGQARRRREKKIHKNRRRANRVDVNGEGTFNVLQGEPESEPPQDGSTARVIESRRFVIKPLTVEEAMLEIEGEKAEFLVFRDASSDRTNVLYRRPDGNFGLIDPEQ
jgi:putative sigma-54 modulation protein